MKFSVIHPTARVTPDFESPWWKAMFSALTGCDNPREVEYVLVVHHSRLRDFWESFSREDYPDAPCIMSADFNPGIPECGSFRVVTNFDRDCLVDQCNAGLAAAQGEIQCWNQDDMRYPPHWDSEILKLIPDTSKLVCIQALTSGGRKDLLTLPSISTMPLARKIGALSPEYDGMFSDDEWSIKARAIGVVVQSTLYFEHLHPADGKGNVDSVHAMENRDEAYRIGSDTFNRRRALGFPRVPLPGETVSEPAESLPLIAVCVPGYDFTFPWLEHFFALGTRFRDEGYIVKRYFGYSSNVYHARMSIMSDVIEAARRSGDTPKYVLWLDSDNVLLPNQLSSLLRYLDAHSDVDAIAGWCWIRKGQDWVTSAGYFWGEDGVHLEHMGVAALLAGDSPTERATPKRIESTGFPCLLMRYEMCEKLGASAFRPLTKADLPAYFDGNMPAKEVTDEWFCGEDTSWCLQAKKAGFKLMVDPMCKVGHLKIQLLEPDFKIEGINGAVQEVPPLEYERVTA